MSDDIQRLNRRRALKLSASMVTIGGLAGCSGGDGGGGDGDGDGSSDGGGSDGGMTTTDSGTPTEEPFPSEDLRIVNTFGSGGSFGAFTNAIGQFLSPHLPNEVNVNVEHMPGGGGRRGAIEIWNAEPDGHTFGLWALPIIPITQLSSDVPFDMREISAIGRFSIYPRVLVANPDSPYQTLDDLANAEETVRAVTPGEALGLRAIVLAREIGYDVEPITGYADAGEARTAIARGDGDILLTSQNPTRPLIEDGSVNVVAYFSDDPPEWDSDGTTVAGTEYASLTGSLTTNMGYGGPPEVPSDRITVLNESIGRMVESQEFVDWATEAQLLENVKWTDPETFQQMINDTLDTYSQYTDIL